MLQPIVRLRRLFDSDWRRWHTACVYLMKDRAGLRRDLRHKNKKLFRDVEQNSMITFRKGADRLSLLLESSGPVQPHRYGKTLELVLFAGTPTPTPTTYKPRIATRRFANLRPALSAFEMF